MALGDCAAGCQCETVVTMVTMGAVRPSFQQMVGWVVKVLVIHFVAAAQCGDVFS